MISLICAMGKGREIGYENGLPWHISEDLKRFKRITMGHPVIMGRLTYESIGKPLPGRTNIVLTNNTEFQADGCVICHSLDDALKIAVDSPGGMETFVIGGANIYQQTIASADRLYLTLVHDSPANCDVYFPDYRGFSNIIKEETAADLTPPCRFVTLDRI